MVCLLLIARTWNKIFIWELNGSVKKKKAKRFKVAIYRNSQCEKKKVIHNFCFKSVLSFFWTTQSEITQFSIPHGSNVSNYHSVERDPLSEFALIMSYNILNCIKSLKETKDRAYGDLLCKYKECSYRSILEE